jgi:F-type H+-transporting ATPase subunit epsilon
MPPKSYQLKIITPQEVVYDGPVLSLVAPTPQGYVGVLTDHAPLVTTLSDGLLTFKSLGKEMRFQIGKGFLEMVENHARILTQSANVA